MITAFRIVSNDLTGRTMSISTEPKNRVGFIGPLAAPPAMPGKLSPAPIV